MGSSLVTYFVFSSISDIDVLIAFTYVQQFSENTGHFSEVVSADTIKLNSENEDYFNEPKYAMVSIPFY